MRRGRSPAPLPLRHLPAFLLVLLLSLRARLLRAADQLSGAAATEKAADPTLDLAAGAVPFFGGVHSDVDSDTNYSDKPRVDEPLLAPAQILAGSGKLSDSDDASTADAAKTIEKTESDLKVRKNKIHELKEKLQDGLDATAEDRKAAQQQLEQQPNQVPGRLSVTANRSGTSGISTASIAGFEISSESGSETGSVASVVRKQQYANGNKDTLPDNLIHSQTDGDDSIPSELKSPIANNVATIGGHRNNSSETPLGAGGAKNSDWTNETLARLEELSHDSNPDIPSSPDDTASTSISKGNSFFSRIASWFGRESGSGTVVPILNSRSQKQIIEELKTSILKHAERQQKEDERVQMRKEALKLAVQELTDMESEINATETVLSKVKVDVNVQRKRMDELEEEKKVRDATEELEKAAEALEEGKMLRVDYETGRVTNLVDDTGSETSSSGHNDGDRAHQRQGQAGADGIPKGNSVLQMLEEELGFNAAKQDHLYDPRSSRTHSVELNDTNTHTTMINVSTNKVEEMKHLVNSDLKNTHYEGIRTGEEAKPRTGHVGSLDNTNRVTTPVPFPKHRTHALPHDILVKASALINEENHGKDELLAAEAHLAAIAEEKQIQNEEKERKPNAKSTHKTASVAPTKISRRMKKAIERARRARRDSDPALIESESGLIIDMAKLMAAAAVGGAVARFARMPIILGFIAGGIFCGPSGLNLVNDIRRMQTLASLGSIFMMFALGVGFPVEEVLRLRKLVVTSTFLGQVAIVILGGYVLTACGFAENIHSAFMVSTGLSVSSTSIVLNHLSSYSTGKGEERSLRPGFGGRSSGSSGIGDGNTSIGLYGRIVLGMVACNELTSAFILSVPELVVPVAATDYLGVLTSNFYRILWLVCVAVFMLMLVLGVGPFKFILRVIDLMISLCLRCVSFRGTQLSYRAVDKGNPRSSGTNHRSSGTNDRGLSQSELQLLILTMVAFCLVCAVITNMAGLSLEMGAFIAGLLVARAAISPRRRDHPGRKNPKRLLAKKSEANSAEASFAASAADEALGTPSKPEDYTHDGPTNRVARGSGRQAFAQMDSSIFISIVMPLRIFFSFLYYATAGMALNPLFMFNNFHVIISFALLTSVCKAAIFTAALLASGAPRMSSVTSGLVMSSVGEISLLYINKAHVLNETLVTRRMMLIYMASTIFSMILTPVILRLFVSRSHHRILHSELVNGGTRYKQAVMEMTTVAFDSGSQEGEHVGGSRRRKKEHNSDEEINVLPV